MIRKLFAVAVLAIAATAATSKPAPAAVICNCFICDGGSGPFCKDPMTGAPTTCSNWWAAYGSHC